MKKEVSMPFIQLLGEDVDLLKAIAGLSSQKGYTLSQYHHIQDLLGAIPHSPSSLIVIAPSRDNRWDVIKVAAKIRTITQDIPLIVIIKQSSEAQIIAALRLGVSDYFKYPVSLPELVARLDSLMSTPSPHPARAALVLGDKSFETYTLIGNSPLIQNIEKSLRNIAVTDSNVLITGETGTGKDLLAHLIHRGSKRHHRPMVCINCAAVPDSLLEGELFGFEKGAFTGAHASYEGKLKLAEGGTVFFDEIGDMSLTAQAKLLQVIERKEIYRLRGTRQVTLDIRIIAATNQNLEKLRSEGIFRSDLYYRLSVADIELPPLRHRKEDIPPLMEHFIRHFNGLFGREVHGCTQEAMDLLLRYNWPGNVRELKNLCEATFINLSAARITGTDLPEAFRQKVTAQSSTMVTERDLLLATLLATNWNKTDTARKLHWSRTTLYRKMAKFKIQVSNRKKCPDRESVPPLATM
jgi:DNA-binding NtrC family response regulator